MQETVFSQVTHLELDNSGTMLDNILTELGNEMFAELWGFS